MLKSKLRKKVLKIRRIVKSNNFKIEFKKVFSLIKKNNLIVKSIGGYFPVNYEIDDLEILKKLGEKKLSISTPFIFFLLSFTNNL